MNPHPTAPPDSLSDPELERRLVQCRVWFARTRDQYAEYRSAEMERRVQREHRAEQRALRHARKASPEEEPPDGAF